MTPATTSGHLSVCFENATADSWGPLDRGFSLSRSEVELKPTRNAIETTSQHRPPEELLIGGAVEL